MKRVYLDNAATTQMAPEVIDAMLPLMKEHFGNPSSTHSYGRKVRSDIEIARRQIAERLNVAPGEILFTSGGTEADNIAINCAVNDLGIKKVISSKIEHHAVSHTLEHLRDKGKIELMHVDLDEKGRIKMDHLRELLANAGERCFVSLMHANNEIGNLIPLKEIGDLCAEYDALFHSDTVQTMGHYKMDAAELNIHFMACSAHKFHGPKGVGFLYHSSEIPIKPMMHGGSQERNRRGGTENVYGIVGLAKAFTLAFDDAEEHEAEVGGLKKYMIERLEEMVPGVHFNGDAKGESLYTVLNVCFPPSDRGDMLLFNLDIAGIAVSGGSACSSGSDVGSHVLAELGNEAGRASVRFSFSRYNTKEDIDYCLEQIGQLMPQPA